MNTAAPNDQAKPVTTDNRILEIHSGPRAVLRELRENLDRQSFESFEVIPLAITFGAEIRGLDLNEVGDANFAELEKAFLAHKVLVFRDQQLDAKAHLELASRFGELEEHPFLPSDGENVEVVRFEKDEKQVGVENMWHADVTWREKPALGAILCAREVPRIGGDTLFADMHAAYRGLPDETREQIDGLRAVHDFSQSFGLFLTPEQLAESRAKFPPVSHPVVRTHPATGEKVLFVNTIFTDCIEGMERADSEALLDKLFRQAAVPEYQCRVSWQPGTVVMWDNRAVQHYAVSDYWPDNRVMERVAIVGDRPV